MTINKLYSKKYLILKVVFACALPFVIELLAMLFDPSDAIMFFFLAMFTLGMIYAVPFVLTIRGLFRYRAKGAKRLRVRKLMFMDFVTLLAPCTVATVFCDTIFAMTQNDQKGQGFFSIIVIGIIILLTLSFWLIYLITSRLGNEKYL